MIFVQKLGAGHTIFIQKLSIRDTIFIQKLCVGHTIFIQKLGVGHLTFENDHSLPTKQKIFRCRSTIGPARTLLW